MRIVDDVEAPPDKTEDFFTGLFGLLLLALAGLVVAGFVHAIIEAVQTAAGS